MKKCFEILEMGVCTDEMVARYAAINIKYWERLERNEITKQETLVGRFQEFFETEKLPMDKAALFNQEYQIRIGDKVFFNDNGAALVKEPRNTRLHSMQSQTERLPHREGSLRHRDWTGCLTVRLSRMRWVW